jgi:hypothetical protein
VNANPQLTVSAVRPAICKGETNTLTATGATTYSWVANTGTTGVLVIHPTSSGIFTVTGYDANGCENTVYYTAIVSSCTGLSEQLNNRLVKVYPNPNAGEFMVVTGSDIVLKVLNNLGQEVRTIELNAGNDHQAEVSGLSNGVYFIVGENAEGKVNHKIIVMK